MSIHRVGSIQRQGQPGAIHMIDFHFILLYMMLDDFAAIMDDSEQQKTTKCNRTKECFIRYIRFVATISTASG